MFVDVADTEKACIKSGKADGRHVGWMTLLKNIVENRLALIVHHNFF